MRNDLPNLLNSFTKIQDCINSIPDFAALPILDKIVINTELTEKLTHITIKDNDQIEITTETKLYAIGVTRHLISTFYLPVEATHKRGIWLTRNIPIASFFQRRKDNTLFQIPDLTHHPYRWFSITTSEQRHIRFSYFFGLRMSPPNQNTHRFQKVAQYNLYQARKNPRCTISVVKSYKAAILSNLSLNNF